MKILFVGPTLYGIAVAGRNIEGTDILCRPPAQQGDIARAVLDGALMIGLVDGRYEDVAAPWHKEILYALDRGVRVYGAASMGALRAAECAAFGMIPVGEIAARYVSGALTDDAAVAQIHGPPELGCVPLSEALVTVEATIDAAARADVVSPAEASSLRASASALFFKDRTFRTVVENAGCGGARGAELVRVLLAHRRDIKREDATALVSMMQNAYLPVEVEPAPWTFRQPSAWRQFMSSLVQERAARHTEA